MGSSAFIKNEKKWTFLAQQSLRVPHLLFVLGYMLHFKKNKNPFVSFHWKFMRYVCTFKHGGGAVYHIIHLHFKKEKKKIQKSC